MSSINLPAFVREEMDKKCGEGGSQLITVGMGLTKSFIKGFVLGVARLLELDKIHRNTVCVSTYKAGERSEKKLFAIFKEYPYLQ